MTTLHGMALRSPLTARWKRAINQLSPAMWLPVPTEKGIRNLLGALERRGLIWTRDLCGLTVAKLTPAGTSLRDGWLRRDIDRRFRKPKP